YYFFFQAEDGIRDRNVTGVQTCALPISAAETEESVIILEIQMGANNRSGHYRRVDSGNTKTQCTNMNNGSIGGESCIEIWPSSRSEERRVGKECRSRRAPYE